MTTSDTTSAVRVTIRRVTPVRVGIVAVVMVAGFAALLVTLSSSIPVSQRVPWQVDIDWRPDLATIQTATVIPINYRCWPPSSTDESWLAPPAITYTSAAVIVTMHSRNGATVSPCLGYDYYGITFDLHLSQPLGGRALFDGFFDPPHPVGIPKPLASSAP